MQTTNPIKSKVRKLFRKQRFDYAHDIEVYLTANGLQWRKFTLRSNDILYIIGDDVFHLREDDNGLYIS